MAEAVNQQPGGGSNYPFMGPSTVPGVLDSYLSYQDDPCAYSWPFTLAYDGTTVEVRAATGDFVFLAPWAGARATPWGSDRQILEWINQEDILRLVVRSTDLAAGTGTLDARTYHRLPARVRSLRLAGQKLQGTINLEAGYNIALTNTPPARKDGGRFTQRLHLNAVPGAGMGRQPGCDQVDTVIRRINNITADASGNFVIDLDNCFRGQIPVTVVEVAGQRTAQPVLANLNLYNDCRPCYDCSYFVRTYRGLKRIWYEWQNSATLAEQVRDTYAANRQRWLEHRACLLNHAARLVASGGHDCKSFVGGMYCNTSATCLQPIELRFTFQLYHQGQPATWPAQVQLLEAYIDGSPTQVEENYSPVVVGPVYRYTLDYANPQSVSQARMRLCVNCTADNTLGVTMTVHVATADLPLVAVPADLQALWAQYGVPAGPTVRALESKTVPMNPDPVPFECAC